MTAPVTPHALTDQTIRDLIRIAHRNGSMVELTAAMRAVLAPALAPQTCQWHQDPDEGYWNTGCGHAWSFEYDGPTENKQQFCGYCGGQLVIAPSEKGQP